MSSPVAAGVTFAAEPVEVLELETPVLWVSTGLEGNPVVEMYSRHPPRIVWEPPLPVTAKVRHIAPPR